MTNDIDVQFLCKDCERYNLCLYYHGRKETSYICKYFHTKHKSGHWIDGHCDCCGKDMAFHIGRCGGNAYTEMFYSDYCPNCGVKMESEVKE